MTEKVQKPFGRVAKRIVIEADDNGTVRVLTQDIPLLALPGPPRPMDSREMVLALMKVNLDYTSALFATMKLEGMNDGKQSSEGESPDASNNKRTN